MPCVARRANFSCPNATPELAFADTDIPLRAGQHMLAPKIVGRLLQALDAQPGMRALVVGLGTRVRAGVPFGHGRQRARHRNSCRARGAGRANLKRAGFGQVEVVTGDTFNLDMGKDYALIAVCGALPLYDDRFARALAVGGKLFVVVGERAAAGSPAGHAHRRKRLEQHRVCSKPPWTRWKMRGAPKPFSSESPAMIREISVEELKARRDRGENPLVLDVREDWELQLARIPDVVHVPMNQIPARLGEFQRDAEIDRDVPRRRQVHARGAFSCEPRIYERRQPLRRNICVESGRGCNRTPVLNRLSFSRSALPTPRGQVI